MYALILVQILLSVLKPLPEPTEPSREVLENAVYSIIMDVHENQTSCRSNCTSTRGYRENIPDYSEDVVTPEVALDLATVLVETHLTYDIPLAEIMATFLHESTFWPRTLGGGTECGMFQQTTRYIRWESNYFSESREEINEWVLEDGTVLSGGEAVCAYLLEPENAAWHFALKYHHEVGQEGENWAAYYNSGSDMWGYQRRHRVFHERMEYHLEQYLEEFRQDEIYLDENVLEAHGASEEVPN